MKTKTKVQIPFAVLGCPTSGKTTFLKSLPPGVPRLDQDDAKAKVAGTFDAFEKENPEMREKMWKLMADTLRGGGVVTFSDMSAAEGKDDPPTPDIKLVRDSVAVAARRKPEAVNALMIKRDGKAHKDALTWTYDWYGKALTRDPKLLIDLADDEFLADYIEVDLAKPASDPAEDADTKKDPETKGKAGEEKTFEPGNMFTDLLNLIPSEHHVLAGQIMSKIVAKATGTDEPTKSPSPFAAEAKAAMERLKSPKSERKDGPLNPPSKAWVL